MHIVAWYSAAEPWLNYGGVYVGGAASSAGLRLLTQHIREFLQVTPGPFPNFWVGPGDEARRN